MPEYKYSAFRLFNGAKLFDYLRMYEKFPHAEMFLKFGLSAYVLSKQLLRKTATDRKFRTWLIRHRDELSGNKYYVGTILLSYKTGKSFEETQRFEELKKSFCNRNNNYRTLHDFFKGRINKFIDYTIRQNISFSLYRDYFNACVELGLDMTEDRNVFPRDFKRWHDIRIDEYATKKAMLDEQKRKELYLQFGSVADKYLALQQSDTHNSFVVVIARSPAELIREGEILHHCVGRMGYDQKFVREESLIFFIRNKDNPDVPFVTLEYSPSNKRVLQCYALNNTRPDVDVMDYVNNVWLPYANRTVKKLLKTAA